MFKLTIIIIPQSVFFFFPHYYIDKECRIKTNDFMLTALLFWLFSHQNLSDKKFLFKNRRRMSYKDT